MLNSLEDCLLLACARSIKQLRFLSILSLIFVPRGQIMATNKELIDKYYDLNRLLKYDPDEIKTLDNIHIETLDYEYGMKLAALKLRNLDWMSKQAQEIYFHSIADDYVKSIKLNDLKNKYIDYYRLYMNKSIRFMEIFRYLATDFIDKYKIGYINVNVRVHEILVTELIKYNSRDVEVTNLLKPIRDELKVEEDILNELMSCVIEAKYNPQIRLTLDQKDFIQHLCENYRQTVQVRVGDIAWKDNNFTIDISIDILRLYLMTKENIPMPTYKNLLHVVEFDAKGNYTIPKDWGKQKFDSLLRILGRIRKNYIAHHPPKKHKDAILNICQNVLKYNQARLPENYAPDKPESWHRFANAVRKLRTNNMPKS